jgi:surfeit locus 1 family protein
VANIKKGGHFAGPSSRLQLIPVLALFSRRWWWSTLLVLAAMAVMIRLGFWQLDRLAQRRARNAEIAHQLALPPLSLNDNSPLSDDLASLKTRQATARGSLDLSRQVALKYQNWNGSPGIHLITPLMIEGSSRAVLVDRGWIPQAEAAPERWSQFDELGQVTITGFIRLSEVLSQKSSDTDQFTPPAKYPTIEIPQTEWFRVDIAAIQAQLPYELLPIYIQQSPPESGNARPPYQAKAEFDLSDGPHLGYAIQWYIFALILLVIYISYVKKEQSTPE